jgi:hypothetical protein
VNALELDVLAAIAGLPLPSLVVVAPRPRPHRPESTLLAAGRVATGRRRVTDISVCIALALAFAAPVAAQRPNAQLTPGATRAVSVNELCTPGTAAKARKALKASTKRDVFRRYGVTPKKGAYEVDHLISLELGGSNDLANLWPESYHGPHNAHEKDALENQLHRLVCTGYVTLSDAQHDIASDWVAALKKYGGKAGPRE